MMLQAPALDVREHALEVIAARGESAGAFPLQRAGGAYAPTGRQVSAEPSPPPAARWFALDGDRARFPRGSPKGFFNKLFNLRPLIPPYTSRCGLSVIPAPEAAAVLHQGRVLTHEAAREAIGRMAAKAGRAP